VRTPLWVAHCVRRIRGLQNIVPLQRARRCGLRVAFVASECRRLSLLRSAHAMGCVLRLLRSNAEEFRFFAPFRCSAMRAPLWAAHCCVASECRRMSLLCIAHAAVGCSLPCCIRMFAGNVFQVDGLYSYCYFIFITETVLCDVVLRLPVIFQKWVSEGSTFFLSLGITPRGSGSIIVQQLTQSMLFAL